MNGPLESASYHKCTLYCNSFYDNFLCWGPTPAGRTAYQNCPTARLSDPTQLAFRTCGEDGLWLGRRQNESTTAGWTNFTSCFPVDVKLLFDQVYEDKNEQLKFDIARNTRILEIVGFSISLVALLLSLFIFTFFRSLNNNRTRIHKNLFSAMVLQVVVRLILYIDQEFVRREIDDDNVTALIRGIDNMPYLCELTYVLLEYGISVMFMWMFIEGLYLNNLVSSNSLRDQGSYLIYLTIGWGVPFVITLVWAVVTGFHYESEEVKKCWYGYNFAKTYWIVQGPRFAVIVVNFLFLVNILKVLIKKMRTSEDNELDRLKKAVRATCFLLPLLGMTNVLDMWEPSVGSGVFQFACWSYISHFLRSFQGFFIALFYCFCNAEVQTVIKKYLANKRDMRETRRRQQLLFRSDGGSTPYHKNRFSFGVQSLTSPAEVAGLVLSHTVGTEPFYYWAVCKSTKTGVGVARHVAVTCIADCRTVSEGTQTRIPMRPVRWTRSQLHLRRVDTGISMPCMHLLEKRRSTGTDTETDTPVPRRASANATLGCTAVNIQHERSIQSIPLADYSFRLSDTRVKCPGCHSNIEETTT